MKTLASIILGMCLSILAAVACAGSGGVETQIFSARFQKIYRDRAELMTEKRHQLEFDSGVVVDDCKGYLEAEKTSTPTSSLTACGYDICHVLDAFGKAAPSTGYKPESYSRELLERFEWRGILEGFEQEEKSGRTLSEIRDPLLTAVDKYSLKRDEKEVVDFSLTVLSDADLNGNGKPDWLISYFEKWYGGSGISCLTGVIWDAGPAGPLEADLYPLRNR